MATKITGTVIRGEGNASRNHSVLIPLLANHVPEIANCSQFGTINIQLDKPLNKTRADVWTPRIIWRPVHLTELSGRIEIFGFIKVRLECPLNGPLYNAWIMLPEGSSLTYRNDQTEIIVDAFVQGATYGASCAVHFDHAPPVVAPRSFGVIYGKSLKLSNEPTPPRAENHEKS